MIAGASSYLIEWVTFEVLPKALIRNGCQFIVTYLIKCVCGAVSGLAWKSVEFDSIYLVEISNCY